MEWISIKEKLPPESYKEIDDEEQEDREYLLLIKYDEDSITTACFLTNKESIETFTEEYFGKKRTITESTPAKKYFHARCPIGEYCSDEEIDVERVTHWMLCPK